MAFEIRARDLLGRIGKLETKSGIVETPVLLPVVNPAIQPIPPRIMRKDFGCTALMTNAYIIRKRFQAKAKAMGVHRFLDFDGAIMTDSGAYQTLIYGDLPTTNKEIIEFQESVNTDIAVILDVPTGWRVTHQYAEQTVEETMRRARELARFRTRDDILWTGPVQGGAYLDLIADSAKKMSKLPFHIHALGSPTPIMEQYIFSTLVDMIVTAKRDLPPDRPLHLFGAGHPFMFALAIALGCDMFDSAAYALFAREDRYMTSSGTLKLSEIEYFPCSCPVCSRASPSEIKAESKHKRQEFLARHNLHISLAEIRRIKQCIVEGRLWEHLEMQSYTHPALFSALKHLKNYPDLLESGTPISKSSGLFFYGAIDLIRPEVVRYGERLKERYSPPEKAKVLVLLPQTRMKPFHRSREHARIMEELDQRLGSKMAMIHLCTFAAPFGVVPLEIEEMYPLSQHEVALPLDDETLDYVAKQVEGYVERSHYQEVILLNNLETWNTRIALAVARVCKVKRTSSTVLNPSNPWNKSAMKSLLKAVLRAIGEKT